MIRTIIFAILALSVSNPLFAQQRPQGGGGGAGAAPKAAETNSNTGIHFVAKDQNPQLKEFYLQMDEKAYKRSTAPMSMAGSRVPFPKNREIRIFSKIPEQGEKPQPLLISKIPQGMGAQVLGILGVNAGRLEITYVDESVLKANQVLFKNMTNNNYLIDITEPAGGEKQQFNLKPGEEYVFGKSFTEGSPVKKFPASIRTLYKLKNGETQWFVDRKFDIVSRPTSAVIWLFMADSQNKRMMLSNIDIYLEK